MERAKSQLPPQRWKINAVLTDEPGPGENYLTDVQIREAIQGANDNFNATDGLRLEFGSFEKIAK